MSYIFNRFHYVIVRYIVILKFIQMNDENQPKLLGEVLLKKEHNNLVKTQLMMRLFILN